MSDYIMTPGARLEAGPGGLYETLGSNASERAIQAKAKADAAKASRARDTRAEAKKALARMRRSLRGWLKYRRLNDEVAAGKRQSRLPRALAENIVVRDRDWAGEQKLAEDLYLLLREIHDPASLPQPNVAADSKAAVKLAELALSDTAPGVEASAPTAAGILPLVVLTIGGIALFALTSFISSRAEVQKEKEHLACIRAGACTDFGFWLKTASVITIGWFLWEKAGVGQKVRGALKR